MTPRDLAECLNIIADQIELDDSPSRVSVASDLRAVLAAMDDSHTAGVLTRMKESLFKTDLEKKYLKKLKSLEAVKKDLPKIVSMIDNGKKLELLTNDEDVALALAAAVKSNKSMFNDADGDLKKLVNACLGDEIDDVQGAAKLLDRHWNSKKGEDHEQDERELLSDALKAYRSKIDSEIDNVAELLQKHRDKAGRERKYEKSGEKKKPKAKPRREMPEFEEDQIPPAVVEEEQE